METRPKQRAKIGDVGQIALAPEQKAADLVLELLDRAAERRLGDVAFLGGAREVPRIADGEEISDVVNVHANPLARPSLLRPMQ